MMKKFLSTPMTWGSCLRFGGIMAAIGCAISAAMYTYICWDEIKSWAGEKIYKILPKKEE